MKKKLIVISEGKLIKNGSASDTVMCGLVDEALNLQYDVSYIYLKEKDKANLNNELSFFNKTPENLKIYQIEFEFIKAKRIKKVFSNFDKSITTKFCGNLNKFKTNFYHNLIAFDSRAIAFAKNISSKNFTVILGDPTGKKVWHSNTWRSPLLKIKGLLFNYIEPIYWKSKIPISWNISIFGTGHVKQWRKIINRNIYDLRPFMPNFTIEVSTKSKKNKKVDFVFGGSMEGTASKMNLIEIFNYYLPVLKSNFGKNFNLYLIGFIPKNIKEEFNISKYKEIKTLGKVDNFEKELSRFDIFFLPSKYPVGVRTRICSALAASCICIVDKNILYNMPELISCSAVKVITNKKDFEDFLNELKTKNNLDLLRKQAKDFFNSNYLAKVTAKKTLN